MNKKEILEEIEKTKEHLANMQKMLQECKYERWKPKKGETYYYLDSDFKIYSEENFGYPSDIGTIKNYNCFQTREEAETEAHKILVRHQLEDIAKRLNKSEEIDWCNLEQKKYYLSCDNYSRCGKICCVCSNNTVQGAVYCLDKNFLDVAKREIGEDRLIKYIRGEG